FKGGERARIDRASVGARQRDIASEREGVNAGRTDQAVDVIKCGKAGAGTEAQFDRRAILGVIQHLEWVGEKPGVITSIKTAAETAPWQHVERVCVAGSPLESCAGHDGNPGKCHLVVEQAGIGAGDEPIVDGVKRSEGGLGVSEDATGKTAAV